MIDIKVIKRDGRIVNFNPSKICGAITHAYESIHALKLEDRINEMTESVIKLIIDSNKNPISVEDIQDIVENVLIENNLPSKQRQWSILG